MHSNFIFNYLSRCREKMVTKAAA